MEINTRKKHLPVFIIFILLVCFYSPLSYSKPLEHFKKDDKIIKHDRRMWHFVLRNVALKDAIWMIDKAKQYGFNYVVVSITDGVILDTSPWTPRQNSWTKNDLILWTKHAKNNGMKVIPEIKLLTHQEKLLQKNYPSLMYNSFTYNPNSSIVYDEIVFPFLDEIIQIINPKIIHIGHDEVAGHNKKSTIKWFKKRKWLDKKERMLPADLFLKDTLKIHKYLTTRNIQTAMWGDMLIAPSEFPRMKNIHLHGGNNGYGKHLRQKLPKDILIFDWHYFGAHKLFPSLKTFQNEGFKVIASTWKNMKTTKNFSDYASSHNNYGVLATTWWHVQKKEWDKVDYILRESSNIFSNQKNKHLD